MFQQHPFDAVQKVVQGVEILEQGLIIGWGFFKFLLHTHQVKQLHERTFTIQILEDELTIGAWVHFGVHTGVGVIDHERPLSVAVNEGRKFGPGYRFVAKERDHVRIAIGGNPVIVTWREI